MNIKKTARFITLAALFLIPIFPLIVAQQFFFPFITGKAFYFRAIVELAFAGWLILALLDAKYRPRMNALTIGVSLFAIVTLVADLLGVNPLRSLWSNFERMEGWVTIIHLWAFYIVAAGMFGGELLEHSRETWRRWFNFELFVALIVGVYGVLQLMGVLAIHQGSTRIDATLGNAAYMAVYMLWNAGLAVYLYFIHRAKNPTGGLFLKWAYPILAVFFSFLLFETATRGTILGLLGGIMVALTCYAFFARGAKKRNRYISGGVVVGVIVLILAFIGLRQQPVVQHNEVLNRLASISLSSPETTARLYIWNMALAGFKERPVLGWGQENFNYIFNSHYDPRLWNQEQWFDRAHNVFLDWLTAGGVIGLLSYLSLYVLFLVAVWRSKLSSAEKSVLSGLLIGYAVHNLFVFDNLASYVLFFAALSFASTLRPGKPCRLWGEKPLSAEAAEYVAAPMIIVALVVLVWFANYRPLLANTGLIGALESCASSQPDAAAFDAPLAVHSYLANQEIREQILNCAGQIVSNPYLPNPTKQAYYNLALQAIQNQIAATPMKDARIFVLGGTFLDTAGQFQLAAGLLAEGYKLSPHKQSIAIELSNSLINLDQKDAAVKLLADAYNAYPSDSQAALAYAIAMVVNNQEAQARQMFHNDPTIFEAPQMATAYVALKEYTKAEAIYQAMLVTNPADENASLQLARIQYAAGDLAGTEATLRALGVAHPEYQDKVDATIKQLESLK